MARQAFWILSGALLVLSAGPARADERVRFNRDVRPILSDKCFHCHGPDAAKRKANLRLDVRASAVEHEAIVAGKPDDSELLARVLSTDPNEQMPPPASKLGGLTPQEADILKRWIAQGAEYENHWAFIPLRPVNVPESNEQSPIDAIVRNALAKRGITPQPEADRSTLIRRVSFDLTGLPPTPAEVEAFLQDTSANAYEKVVDRLLKSEHYGERMAVDWLDSARYADSFGFQVDREREMYPWRDWVVRAYNANLSFDQFITWQLAGDLLPNATDDQVLATAFNRLHQQEAEGGSVEEEYRVEYVCDRVQTFATTFLGLTFECARCHDHKFDPITQREFYQLFSYFQNIDEAGLYSYFTPSPPTPTLMLMDTPAHERLAAFEKKISDLEQQSAAVRESRREACRHWLAQPLDQKVSALGAGELARFSFDAVEKGKLGNGIKADQPGELRGENKIVPGKIGNAVEFTGDDPVDLPLGNFHRQEPFSISLWVRTPDRKERAVVLHRSRAWTDAASRGYELLIEDGRLKWSLIHFWPGNAISIAARSELPVGEWTHLVISSDGSSRAAGLKLYVNGQPVDVEIVKDKLTKDITGGGGDNIALGERFRDRGFTGGQIDELRVFGRELTRLEALSTFDADTAKALLAKPAEQLSDRERESLFEFALAADFEWQKHLAGLRSARDEQGKFVDGIRELMVMRELPEPKPAYVLFRGEYTQRRDEVHAGTPAALSPFPDGAPQNRLGLARWLTDRRHPLTARVTVNRVWQSLFGRGLVKTSEDFGSQGARPL
ncbi:MAG TPA: DUF1549 domain-containing protein, partial [Planctomycetaceae bacterium]|nr:DUF1549 domain-containing protein [Planctomycetaceae bacterium]